MLIFHMKYRGQLLHAKVLCLLLMLPREYSIEASAKTGMGVEKILRDIVNRIPPPEGSPDAPLQALIFDSIFNSFRGIIAYFKIINGTIRKGDKVKFVGTDHEYNAEEIGVLKLKKNPRDKLG